jgi:serine/threonine protein kinase
MELLGQNLAKLKRNSPEGKFSRSYATRLLMQMLEAVRQVHDKGFIHRDIKASNFLLGKDNRSVYIADFGLAKAHIAKDGEVVPARHTADFRGTISFASLNAHN